MKVKRGEILGRIESAKKMEYTKRISVFNLSLTIDNRALVLNMPEKQVEKLVVSLVSYVIFLMCLFYFV